MINWMILKHTSLESICSKLLHTFSKNPKMYYCEVTSVVSDSVWPHRRQPTSLTHPWDSPGKNTGVGCHFLLQCMRVKSESGVDQSCLILNDPMDCSPPGSSIHGIFQTRVLEWVAIAFSVFPCIPPLIITLNLFIPVNTKGKTQDTEKLKALPRW